MNVDKLALEFYQCCLAGINGKHVLAFVLLVFIIAWFCEWFITGKE